VKITFFGAAQNVTGSKHLIEVDGFKLLLDCGLFQGRRQEVNVLNRNLPFSAKKIDAVILSHAHADHCGMLPVLVKQGFHGKIYATSATTDITEYILRDSAKIQEQDSQYFNDNLPPGADPIAPLYTEEDATAVSSHFQPTPYFRLKPAWTNINTNIRFKFYDAGHILGSAITVIEITENGETKRIGFTGDMGKGGAPLLHDPELITEPLDALLMECTYGGRNHRSLDLAAEELVKLTDYAITHHSRIIVPAFALGRTQELIYILHKLTDENKIPRIPIYIDSPLATNIGDVFLRHPEDFNKEAWTDFGKNNEVPLLFRNLIYVNSIEQSKALNAAPGPFMVISASGMMEGGRILHHLKNNVGDHNSLILITGYQAEHTLGRKIQNGISPVNIFGRAFQVKAQIVTLDEFSAHADQQSLLNYLEHIPLPKQLALVHTELPQATIFRDLLKKYFPELPVTIPTMGQSVEI